MYRLCGRPVQFDSIGRDYSSFKKRRKSVFFYCIEMLHCCEAPQSLGEGPAVLHEFRRISQNNYDFMSVPDGIADSHVNQAVNQASHHTHSPLLQEIRHVFFHYIGHA